MSSIPSRWRLAKTYGLFLGKGLTANPRCFSYHSAVLPTSFTRNVGAAERKLAFAVALEVSALTPILQCSLTRRVWNFGYSAAHEADPLPLLPSGPGGVHGESLHRARSSTDGGRGEKVSRA